ncbi:MAG TPA: YutD family protein, partial [Candidatus Pseudogracilibacillus intestinigallinarum]|nr:YutD family protein [Candidatus Pseudogracilibacillus intestinigallinarum]
KATYDSRIDMVEDYILEYCNFGCAYFILKKVDE